MYFASVYIFIMLTGILTGFMLTHFISSIKDRDPIKALVSIFLALVFFIICLKSYNLYISNIKTQKQLSHIKQEISKLKKLSAKNKKDEAYIYGIMLNGSNLEDKRIVECYKKFHNFKETAQCVKGTKKY